MSAIDKIIDEALRNAETYTREEQEGYREVYISYEDVEKLAYEVAKQALYEFEDKLYDELSGVDKDDIDAHTEDIDIDLTVVYDKVEKELGL